MGNYWQISLHNDTHTVTKDIYERRTLSMVTDITELIKLCSAELNDRQYKTDYAEKIQLRWNELKCWMEKNSLTVFSERIANQYCDSYIGTHLLLE